MPCRLSQADGYGAVTAGSDVKQAGEFSRSKWLGVSHSVFFALIRNVYCGFDC
jgi:hypothetical protein